MACIIYAEHHEVRRGDPCLNAYACFEELAKKLFGFEHFREVGVEVGEV